MSTAVTSLVSKLNSNLDLVDKWIIFLITQGCTSSYAVWAAMQKESRINHNSMKVLAYKNIHQHAINLAKEGYLEDVKLEAGANVHGRRDYKVTMQGMMQLIIHCIEYPTDIKSLVTYMEQIKLDKQPFTDILVDTLGSLSYAVNLYLKDIEDNLTIEWKNGHVTKVIHAGKEDIDIALDELYEQLRHILVSNKIMNTLQNDGKTIGFGSHNHPHTPKQIAKLTNDNIEKMKKVISSNT